MKLIRRKDGSILSNTVKITEIDGYLKRGKIFIPLAVRCEYLREDNYCSLFSLKDYLNCMECEENDFHYDACI